MNQLDYEADFEVALDIVLTKLAVSPWDLDTLQELRTMALRRVAFGVPKRGVKKRRTNDVKELLDWYRQMAMDPTEPTSLLEINRLARFLAPTLDKPNRDAAEHVELWAKALVEKIVKAC